MNKKPFIICMAIIACLAVVTGAYSAFGNQFVNIKGEKVSYKTVSAAAASAKSKHPRRQVPSVLLSKPQPSLQRKELRKVIITATALHRVCLILSRLIKHKTWL